MDVHSTAIQGMYSSYERLYGASVTIANGEFDYYADAFVEMIRAKHSHAANIKVVQAQREMDQSLFDIFA